MRVSPATGDRCQATRPWDRGQATGAKGYATVAAQGPGFHTQPRNLKEALYIPFALNTCV